MKFEDRTVIVTGAGRGIGRAIALGFAEEGARVALVARTEDDAAAITGATLEVYGGTHLTIQP